MQTYNRSYRMPRVSTQSFLWAFKYRSEYRRRPSLLKPLIYFVMQMIIFAQLCYLAYTLQPDPAPLVILGVPAIGWAIWRTIEVMKRT